jgi:hypothetical protein
MSQREWLERPLCPLRSGVSCKGAECAVAVSLKREGSERLHWVCGLARAERGEGRVVVDVTRIER